MSKFKFCFIISALLFSIQIQARTIMVGPGKEYSEPQAAFKACKAGDVIKIMKGRYETNENFQLYKKKNVKVIGLGEVWLLATHPYFDVFRLTGCENIVIKNIHMKHKEPRKNSPDYACGGSVLVLESCKNILVQKCEMNGCGRIGVNFSYSEDYSNILIKKCLIHDNSLCAFRHKENKYFKATEMQHLKWLILKKNKVMNNGPK